MIIDGTNTGYRDKRWKVFSQTKEGIEGIACLSVFFKGFQVLLVLYYIAD